MVASQWKCRGLAASSAERSSPRYNCITGHIVSASRNIIPRRTHNMSSTSFAVAVMQMIIKPRSDEARRMSRCGASCLSNRIARPSSPVVRTWFRPSSRRLSSRQHSAFTKTTQNHVMYRYALNRSRPGLPLQRSTGGQD
jgi:hypothetical protein